VQEPSVALEVLDRAIGELDLRGVSLLTTINHERLLVTEGTVAVSARIAELGVPPVLHPGFRSSTRLSTRTSREEVGLSWIYQTALAALELIDEGVLDAVPDRVVVHPHLGGVLPYVTARISPVAGSKAQYPLEHYLKTRFYVDTAVGHSAQKVARCAAPECPPAKRARQDPTRFGRPSRHTGSNGSVC
jgi:predicted TIM-barrel fold metal-dependent hydrolase